MKVNCLFCLNLDKKQAKQGFGSYCEPSYGKCYRKGFHVRDPVRNCTWYRPMGADGVEAHIDMFQRYADNFSHILERMREEKQEWIK